MRIGARSLLAPATAILVSLLAAGCATPFRLPPDVDPLGLLGPGAVAYARLDGEAARALAPALLPPDQKKALDPLLRRTTRLAISVGSPAGEGEGARALRPGSRYDLEAAFVGDYPYRTAALALRAQPGWKLDGDSFYNDGTGIRASMPGPNLVLASTRDFRGLVARARSPGASPLPPRLDAFASKELLVYAPDPLRSLTQSMGGDAISVPLRGLLISATRKEAARPAGASPAGAASAAAARGPGGDPGGGPVEDGNRAAGPSARPNGARSPGDDVYSVTIAFLMDDAESARIFRPALRLAWFFVARSLLPGDSGVVLAARFATEGEIYWASGVELKASSLAGALERLQEAVVKKEKSAAQRE